MDPLSHTLIGLSIFAMKNTPTLSNPATLGAMMGAIAPDFDIIARLKGDYVYLKHHRIETHSLPGIIILSLIVTSILSVFYKDFLFKEVFFWTLIGGLSHILFDYLNSYGVALLYPLNRKKYTINLLMIYDPILILMKVYIIFFGRRNFKENLLLFLIFIIYLMIRRYSRLKLKVKLSNRYKRLKKIELMPSTFNPFKWDFIVETKDYFFVGEINILKEKIFLLRELKKVESEIIQRSLKEELGVYFRHFTPFFHIDVIEKEKERIIVKMTDLRYRMKNEFMHHACFYYNSNTGDLTKSIFHSFVLENKIEFYENNRL